MNYNRIVGSILYGTKHKYFIYELMGKYYYSNIFYSDIMKRTM